MPTRPAAAVPRDRPGIHVPELDGLRGVAIVLVMVFHFWDYAGLAPLGFAIRSVKLVGWAGVDIFFALSGFLIAGILLDTRDREHYWRNFYVRRALRIFPLYYAVMIGLVVLALGVRALGIPIADPALRSPENAWVNFIYVTNFAVAIHGANWAPLDIAWSLAIEEQFYLLFPFLVRWASPRALLWTLVGACLLAPLLRAGLFVASGYKYYVPYVLPFCRMDTLAFGAIAAIALRHEPALRQRLAGSAPLLWLGALAVHAPWGRGDLPFVAIGYSMVGLATAATILWLLDRPRSPVHALLATPALAYLGRISYGLYLLHLFARAAVDQGVMRPFFPDWRQDLGLALFRLCLEIALAVLLAALSWRLFEQPILKLKDRWAPPQPPARGRAADPSG